MVLHNYPAKLQSAVVAFNSNHNPSLPPPWTGFNQQPPVSFPDGFRQSGASLKFSVWAPSTFKLHPLNSDFGFCLSDFVCRRRLCLRGRYLRAARSYSNMCPYRRQACSGIMSGWAGNGLFMWEFIIHTCGIRGQLASCSQGLSAKDVITSYLAAAAH